MTRPRLDRSRDTGPRPAVYGFACLTPAQRGETGVKPIRDARPDDAGRLRAFGAYPWPAPSHRSTCSESRWPGSGCSVVKSPSARASLYGERRLTASAA